MTTASNFAAVPLALLTSLGILTAVAGPVRAAPASDCVAEAASLRAAAVQLDARDAGRVLREVTVAEKICAQHNRLGASRKLASARKLIESRSPTPQVAQSPDSLQ